MKEYRLSDILDIKHGFAFDGEYISSNDNGIVLVTPGNFKIGGGFQEDKCKFFYGEIPKEYILEPGSFIVTMTDLSKGIDTLGYSAVIPKHRNRVYLHNQRIGLVNFISDECDRGYIYYLMQTHTYQRSIANSSTGSTVHHTSPTRIKEYCFVAPKLSQQRKISKILSAYDNLIENNQKQIKLLEEAAQRLYKEWFVVDGMTKGWRKTNINEILTFHRGYDLTKVNMEAGPYPVVGATSILGYHREYKIPGPGIVTGRSGSLGQYQFIWGNFWPHNTSLYVSDFKGHDIFYIFNLLKTVDFSVLNNGGAIPTLNRNTLSNIEILEPPSALQAQYGAIAEPFYKKCRVLNLQNQKLTEARDRLLPKLMSGEIEV